MLPTYGASSSEWTLPYDLFGHALLNLRLLDKPVIRHSPSCVNYAHRLLSFLETLHAITKHSSILQVCGYFDYVFAFC